MGGGYIAFEFAHVAAWGAEVTILHRGARPLQGFDPDLVALLVQHTRALGVRIEPLCEVCGIEQRGDEVSVRAITAGQERCFAADMAVHGAGRVPEIDDLDLETAGGARTARGDGQRLLAERVEPGRACAAGDAAASGPPLTPTAAHEGRGRGGTTCCTATTGRLNRARQAWRSRCRRSPPWGWTEEAAHTQGRRFQTRHRHLAVATARRARETASGHKVLVETRVSTWAHLLGPHAEEVINIFAAAVRFGIRADELKQMLFAYPTSASDVVHML